MICPVGGAGAADFVRGDTTFTPACREDLIALMPSHTVVTDLTGGHLALMVRLEQYADLVTKFILERTP